MQIFVKEKNISKIDEIIDTKSKKCVDIDLDLLVNFDKHSAQQLLKIIDNYAKTVKNFNFKSVNVIFETENYVVDKQKLDFIYNQNLRGLIEPALFFWDKDEKWDISKVKNAYDKIFQVVDDIKKNNLSPYEAYLYAYIYATQFKYSMENKGQSGGISRSIFGILNSDKIVCEGYCSLIMAIIENLKTNNITIFDNDVCDTSNDDIVLHDSMVVYLIDKKYNILGYYFSDPTADSEFYNYKSPKNRNYQLVRCLVPLKDLSTIEPSYSQTKNSYLFDYSSKAEHFDSEILNRDLLSFSSEKLKINKQFQKALNDNFKIIDDLNKKYSQIKKDDTPLCKYLKKDTSILEQTLLENSQPISTQCLEQALKNIFNAMKLFKNKNVEELFVDSIILYNYGSGKEK